MPKLTRVPVPDIDAEALGCRCSECPLQNQTKPIAPRVNKKASLVILGEAPGENEVEQGEFFVGESGQFLDRALEACEISRTQLHITNTLLCKPHRKLTPGEWGRAIAACKPRLHRELSGVLARSIFVVGARGLQVLTGKKKITPWLGSLQSGTDEFSAWSFISSYHPAFMLRPKGAGYIPVFRMWLERAWQLAQGKLKPWKWPKIVTKGPYAIHLDKLRRERWISVDIENKPSTGHIRCIGVGTKNVGISVPLAPEGDANDADIKALRALLADKNVGKIFHNCSHDLIELEESGWEVNGPTYDTLAAHAVVAPAILHNLSLACAIAFHAPNWKSEFHIEGDDKGKALARFEKAPLSELLDYNAKDNIMQAKLMLYLEEHLDGMHNGRALYDAMLRRIMIAIAMEKDGIRVDAERRAYYDISFRRRRARAARELRLIARAVKKRNWRDFKIGSTDELKDLFFEKLKCHPTRYSEETGEPSLDDKAISHILTSPNQLARAAARCLKRVRKWHKYRKTYIKGISVVDGKLHVRWKPFGTITLRWSSNPNLQNIPKPVTKKLQDGRSKVIVPGLRDLFVSDRDKFLLEADYSQLELRIVAFLANDPLLLRWYGDGEDVHTFNAKDLFATQTPTKAERDFAKTFVYACVPMDTKALTKEGWKTYEQLKVGDLVLSYNQMTKMKEWTPVLRKFKKRDEVFELKNRTFNVRATGDHRWFVKQRKRVGMGWSNYPYMKDEVRTTLELNTESNVLVNAPMANDVNGTDKFPTDKFTSAWTNTVCRMSSAQRKAFLAGFLLADGWKHENGNWGWNQLDNEIADAALTASYIEHPGVCSISRYKTGMVSCNMSKKGHCTGQKLQRQSLGVQDVWCITTKNESWVMRQGDFITITGNCNYGASPKTVWQNMVLKFPAAQLSMIEKLMMRWFRTHHWIKTWHNDTLKFARTHGYVEAPLSGQRRYFHGRQIDASAALNYGVQTTGADIINRAIEGIAKELPNELRVQAHDALIVETANPKRSLSILKKYMEAPVELNGVTCKFPVDAKLGLNWGNMVEVHHVGEVDSVAKRLLSASEASEEG